MAVATGNYPKQAQVVVGEIVVGDSSRPVDVLSGNEAAEAKAAAAADEKVVVVANIRERVCAYVSSKSTVRGMEAT